MEPPRLACQSTTKAFSSFQDSDLLDTGVNQAAIDVSLLINIYRDSMMLCGYHLNMSVINVLVLLFQDADIVKLTKENQILRDKISEVCYYWHILLILTELPIILAPLG